MWYSKSAQIVVVSKCGEINTSSMVFSISTFIQRTFHPWDGTAHIHRESLTYKHVWKHPYRDMLYGPSRHFVTQSN